MSRSKKFDPTKAIYDASHIFSEHGGVNMSICRNTTYTYLNGNDMTRVFHGQMPTTPGQEPYLYSRHSNPTVDSLGKVLAAMENFPACLPVASGMSAISCTLGQLLNPGDTLLSSSCIYGGTHTLLEKEFPQKRMIKTIFFNIDDHDGLVKLLQLHRPLVIYAETLANPLLRVADLKFLSRVAKKYGATLVIDNTFTPLSITPQLFGANIVIHSLTKYIGGRSLYTGGAICASQEFIDSLRDVHDGAVMLNGPTMQPDVAFEFYMQFSDLHLRFAEQSRRALALAKLFKSHNLPVYYPGLSEHPDHQLYKSMMMKKSGFGGIVAVDFGSEKMANSFMEHAEMSTKAGLLAVSLGSHKTLMSCSGSSTSSEISEADQKAMGLKPGLVRISLGVMSTLDDQIKRFEQTLASILSN